MAKIIKIICFSCFLGGGGRLLTSRPDPLTSRPDSLTSDLITLVNDFSLAVQFVNGLCFFVLSSQLALVLPNAEFPERPLQKS